MVRDKESGRMKLFTRADIQKVLDLVDEMRGGLHALSETLNGKEGGEPFDGLLEIDAGDKMYEGLGWISKFTSKAAAAFDKARIDGARDQAATNTRKVYPISLGIPEKRAAKGGNRRTRKPAPNGAK